MALNRSDVDRMLLGVCGGLAATVGLNALWVRLGFVILSLASGVGVVLYLLLMFVMLPPGLTRASFRDRMQSNLDMLGQLGDVLKAEWDKYLTRQNAADLGLRIRSLVGGVLGLFGLFILLWSFDLFWWLTFGRALALIMILLGVGLLRAGART